MENAFPVSIIRVIGIGFPLQSALILPYAPETAETECFSFEVPRL